MLGKNPMHPDQRLLARACCFASLVASHAHAQLAPPAALPPPAPPAALAPPAPPAALPPPPAAPSSPSGQGAAESPPVASPAGAPPASEVNPPDALEAPDSYALPSEPKPVAAPVHKIDLTPPNGPAGLDERPARPIRAQRKLALLGEVAWNGLAGFGPILTYHVDPHFSADLGAGFSLLGWKVGVRGRYNFLSDSFTPFIGVGFNYAGGLGQFTTDPSSDPNGDPNREPVTINQGPSSLIQGVVGFDVIHRRGFTMLGTLGYAWLLNRDNYQVLAGKLKPDEKQGFDIAFKGGLVLGVAMGYAFR